VGLPKLSTLKDKFKDKNQQLSALSNEIESLRLGQRIQAAQISRQNASYKSQRKPTTFLTLSFRLLETALLVRLFW
jgi:hypothetical protein